MNKAKYFIYIIISCNFIFAAGGGGSWINDWLMPNTGLTLWTITTFLVLLIVLRWKAWGPLMDALESRAKSIEESLSKAELVAEQAKDQAKENEAILEKAREEASNIIAEAKQAGENLRTKLEENGKAQYESLISKAQDDIDAAKNKALSDIKNMVVEIALEASEKIVKRNLNNDDNQRIIEETVKSFQEKN
tara:strand:- start:3878 stop:4453 length:576 start_codon:yes stop_codon:yes gene_type:complete